MTGRPSWLVLALLGATMSGCGGAESDPGTLATWRLMSAVDDASASFTAGVQRVECADGETGSVIGPRISVLANEIVVTFFVEQLASGTYSCEENDVVPVVVDLPEAVANRALTDGACLRAGDLRASLYCQPGPERWQPS